MEVQFNYFGMIRELLSREGEKIEIDGHESNIRKIICTRYPQLASVSFTIAVNQEIRETLKSGEAISEIALLPPFAGG